MFKNIEKMMLFFNLGNGSNFSHSFFIFETPFYKMS